MAADDTRFQQQVDNKNPRSLEEFKKDPQSRVSDAFDRARNAQQEQKQSAAPDKQGSQQVKDSAPIRDGPKPPSNVRGAVDRQAHNNSMAKDNKAVDQAAAREKMEAINKNQEQEKNKEPEK